MPRNKFFIGLLCGLLLTGPAFAGVFYPETTTLKNGMQLVVIPNHRAPVVTHMLWFKTGAINDPWTKSGIAHFLEHLMFKGTKNHPEGEYSKIISRLGGEQNAFTSYDYTAYYASVGKESLEKIMELEADRLANWQINESQIATERDVILKERQQRTENDPVSAFFEEVNVLLFANHPYQRPTIGWREEMETLNLKDAQDFHEKYYAPNNAILVLSGDITLKDATALVEKYYAGIPARAIAARVSPIVPDLKAPRRISEASPMVRETVWSRHFLLPHARPVTIKQSDAMTLLVKIMGDSRTGRLYRRLVVKDKLATNASMSFDPVAFGPARLSIVVTPKPDADLAAIEKIVDEEVNAVAKNNITEAELKKAAEGMEIDAAYARDSVMGPAMAIGEALIEELDIKTIESWPERIKTITIKDVAAQAKLLAEKNRYGVTAILTPEAK